MAGYDRALYQTYLSSVPMFRSCTTEQLDRIARLGNAVNASGADIIREGDPGTAFFVLTSGTARVVRNGREVTTLQPGDYFGELSLFDPARRDATVIANGTVSLVSLSRDAFLEVLDETPAVRDTMLHGMAKRLHELDAPRLSERARGAAAAADSPSRSARFSEAALRIGCDDRPDGKGPLPGFAVSPEEHTETMTEGTADRSGAVQLRLLPGRTDRPDWVLDERTRKVGRQGIAQALEILRRVAPPEPEARRKAS